MIELIDSHCHLDFDAFNQDREQVLRRAQANGISHIVIPGVSRQRWPSIQAICNTNTNLHACYGLHPYEVEQHSTEDIDLLAHWIEQNHCVAVGECGLDYRSGQANKQRQKIFFEAQLDMANSHHLPVVIHSVRATADVIECLYQRPGLTGMVHSYSGSYEQAMQLIEQGFYISLGGAFTYERAHKLRKTASRLPLDHLLLETDAPDQPDTLHNGERNEPGWLVNVLDSLYELRSESRDEISAQTTANAKKLFNI